jgi:hypothetical protein
MNKRMDEWGGRDIKILFLFQPGFQIYWIMIHNFYNIKTQEQNISETPHV